MKKYIKALKSMDKDYCALVVLGTTIILLAIIVAIAYKLSNYNPAVYRIGHKIGLVIGSLEILVLVLRQDVEYKKDAINE